MSAIHPLPTRDIAFERILCATGWAGDDEATSQAASLAGAGGTVEFLAVAAEHAPGAPHPVPGQIASLVRAGVLSAKFGVRAEPHIVEAPDDVDGILSRAPGHDLLVLPAGEAAMSVLTRSPIPVLVARPPQPCSRFPESILIAVDETREARAAARLGARIAAEHDALVALVATPEHDAPHREALDGHIAAVVAATGERPLILDEQAPPVPAIVHAARSTDASLIVIGSRGGRHENSVSEHVARSAGCSVLVLRTESWS